MSIVRVLHGHYRGETFSNQEFQLIQDLKQGARGSFITVHPNDTVGVGRDKIRINVDQAHIEYVDKPVVARETDDQVMDRIEQRFNILDEMTRAAINSDIRAMIVVGPPGVGKSFGVETQLEKASMLNRIAGKPVGYEIVKGAVTPIRLYTTLYQNANAGNVLVFDDCDSVLLDDLSLNLLKAALDSGRRRRIHWNSDSSLLRREGIPDHFDFKGSVIFITNLKFDNLKSKKLQDHLEALQSRCHFIDLTLNTMRDKFLRIKQIYRKGDLFLHYDFDNNEGEQVIEFMDKNKNQIREMSLRMALKIADLIKVSPDRWQLLAKSTCMKDA